MSMQIGKLGHFLKELQYQARLCDRFCFSKMTATKSLTCSSHDVIPSSHRIRGSTFPSRESRQAHGHNERDSVMASEAGSNSASLRNACSWNPATIQ